MTLCCSLAARKMPSTSSYCRLASDSLARAFERPVVTQLLREHPYALFVFSKKGQTDWHFLIVKYDDQAERRRLFRRITVRPGWLAETWSSGCIRLLTVTDLDFNAGWLARGAVAERADDGD